MVDLMHKEHQVSLRQGCKAVNLPRSSYSYQRKLKDDQVIIKVLLELTSKHPAIGFWQCYHRIRSMGHRWNHKRVYRVYRGLELNIRRRAKKRLLAQAKLELFQPEGVNQVWILNFMHDSIWNGPTFRMLNVMDDYNCQVLWIETDTSLSVARLTRVLE